MVKIFFMTKRKNEGYYSQVQYGGGHQYAPVRYGSISKKIAQGLFREPLHLPALPVLIPAQQPESGHLASHLHGRRGIKKQGFLAPCRDIIYSTGHFMTCRPEHFNRHTSKARGLLFYRLLQEAVAMGLSSYHQLSTGEQDSGPRPEKYDKSEVGTPIVRKSR